MKETYTLMIDVFIFSHVFSFSIAFRKHSDSFLSLLIRVVKIVEKHFSKEKEKDKRAVLPTIQLHTAVLACDVLGEISLS